LKRKEVTLLTKIENVLLDTFPLPFGAISGRGGLSLLIEKTLLYNGRELIQVITKAANPDLRKKVEGGLSVDGRKIQRRIRGKRR